VNISLEYFQMSSPQYQVFRKGSGSYRYLVYPLPKQQLQLLYPGRLMNNQMSFTGNNIPNEHPVELERQRQLMANLTETAIGEQEMVAREKLGVDPVIPFGVVAPEAQLEDPALKALTMSETPVPIEYGDSKRENFEYMPEPQIMNSQVKPGFSLPKIVKSLVYPSTSNSAFPVEKREIGEFVEPKYTNPDDKPNPPILWWGSGGLLGLIILIVILVIIYKSKQL